jgi:hypothetical protein
VIVPALAASVQGLAARKWLTPAALDALARLGVATVRWRVAAGEQPDAVRHAASIAGPGRPALLPVPAEDAPAPLVLTRAPAAPRDETFAAALAALGADPLALDRALPPGLFVPLAHDGPAHLIQLRLAPDGVLDLAPARVERVFIDGRAVR